MIKIKDWSIVKDILDTRLIPVEWIDIGHAYWIVVADASFQVEMFLTKTTPKSADQVDFEDNYKPNGNISKSDSEGSLFYRPKFTKTGWHYQLNSFEIKTSDPVNGYYNKDRFGDDLGFIDYKMLDESRVETAVVADAKYTEVLWTPNHDYMMLMGILTQEAPPTDDLRLWITAVPGIADINFGNGGINMKLAGPGKTIDADGKAAKTLKYNDPIPGTNTLMILLEHGTKGMQHSFQVHFGIFRP